RGAGLPPRAARRGGGSARMTVAAWFEAWDDPEVDACAVPVDGGYSRTAWRPVLGATTWQVWGTLASRLRDERRYHGELADLAPPQAPGAAVVSRALSRLEAYD